jgi:hypothetical protein
MLWVGTRRRSGSIDPATLANLELYLRSDQIGVGDGAAVSTWNDISGNARHATQGTAAQRPIFRTTGADISPSGKPMVDFVDDNDNMAGPLPGGGVSIAAGCTIYVYCKELSLTAGGAFSAQEVFSCANNVSVFELITRSSTALGVGLPDQEYALNSGNGGFRAMGATALGYQTLSLVFEPPAGAGASFKLYKNGSQQGTTQTNWQAVDIRTGYTVGNSGSANTAFRGTIGAVLVFSTAHSNLVRTGVESFLSGFFG